VREDGRVTTLGAVFLPDLPPERLRDVALAADRAGLEELWLWEDCFKESGVASAAAALAWTGRVRVGVGLLPVPLRNVALTAMEVATLHRLFPDRVRIGVGHGVQEWMAQVGAQVSAPTALLGEYVIALRALLRGERVNTSGRYVRLDQVALDWPPTAVPEVLVGAVGPRTLRLSGQYADGTILTADMSPSAVVRARQLVDEGRARGGRTDQHTLVVYVQRPPGADAATVAATVRTYAESGADTVVLQPAADDPDPEGFVSFIANAVRPLVA
jgi:alkanesulfonate monooxygenase SsuD/methylene tetrahydromethanopterin reductase-like flavin-dependent oxidoreductase (luciferase family)